MAVVSTSKENNRKYFSVSLLNLHFIYFFHFFSCSTQNQALVHYLVCYVPLLFVMLALPFIYWKAYRKGMLLYGHEASLPTD